MIYTNNRFFSDGVVTRSCRIKQTNCFPDVQASLLTASTGPEEIVQVTLLPACISYDQTLYYQSYPVWYV